MNIRYRQARPEDLPQCADLFLESLRDLRLRHNSEGPALPSAPEMLTFYQHVLATGFFHVAEAEDRIAALACAVLRDDLWFLSGFWARPELQRQHVGMPVLRSVWEAGKEAGAKVFFVDASRDLPALAAYMKIGMLPGCHILVFEGTPQPTRDVSADYVVGPLEKSYAMELDQIIRGTRRELDHDYFGATGLQGQQVSWKGEIIGYYYLEGGWIGPAAWKDSAHGESLLTLAFREATAASANIVIQVPGMNHAALRFALRSGLRLTSFSHLLMSAPFGRLEQYIPSGPGLF